VWHCELFFTVKITESPTAIGSVIVSKESYYVFMHWLCHVAAAPVLGFDPASGPAIVSTFKHWIDSNEQHVSDMTLVTTTHGEYVEIFKAYFPNAAMTPDAAQRIARTVTNREAWQGACETFLEKRWNPTNLDNLLDRYATEEAAISLAERQQHMQTLSPLPPLSREEQLESWHESLSKIQRKFLQFAIDSENYPQYNSVEDAFRDYENFPASGIAVVLLKKAGVLGQLMPKEEENTALRSGST
jgi:hypothetical protein